MKLQYDKVSSRVSALLAAGLHSNQIILLGTRRLERSFLANRQEVARLPVRSFDEAVADDCLRYSTLHRFKGFEADVALLCDLGGNTHICTRRHVYVAASRAKHRLHTFSNAEVLTECGWLKP
jgi:hypothetical protein